MQLLFIDNYDSFSYTIIDYLTTLGADIICIKNDARFDRKNLSSISGIVFSPGPCSPKESGICKDIIFENYRKLPMLGVCLGMQIINEVFGGKTAKSSNPMHGKRTEVFHNGLDLFKDIPSPYSAACYNSLMCVSASPFIEVTARSSDDIIMAIRHKKYPIYGVQFHPESFLSEHGYKLFENFLDICR